MFKTPVHPSNFVSRVVGRYTNMSISPGCPSPPPTVTSSERVPSRTEREEVARERGVKQHRASSGLNQRCCGLPRAIWGCLIRCAQARFVAAMGNLRPGSTLPPATPVLEERAAWILSTRSRCIAFRCAYSDLLPLHSDTHNASQPRQQCGQMRLQQNGQHAYSRIASATHARIWWVMWLPYR